jgi:hypothetical protein
MPTLVKEGEEEQHNKMEDVDWYVFINIYFIIFYIIYKKIFIKLDYIKFILK